MIKSTLNLDYYIYILYMYLYSMCSRWLWNFVSTKYAFHDEKYYLWTPCRGRTRAWEGWRMLAENIVVFSYRSQARKLPLERRSVQKTIAVFVAPTRITIIPFFFSPPRKTVNFVIYFFSPPKEKTLLEPKKINNNNNTK